MDWQSRSFLTRDKMDKLHAPTALPPAKNRRLDKPQSLSETLGEEKNILALPRIEPQFLGCPVGGLVVISNTVHRLLRNNNNNNNNTNNNNCNQCTGVFKNLFLWNMLHATCSLSTQAQFFHYLFVYANNVNFRICTNILVVNSNLKCHIDVPPWPTSSVQKN